MKPDRYAEAEMQSWDPLTERLNLLRAETARQPAGILRVLSHRLDAVLRGLLDESVAKGGVIGFELAVSFLLLSACRRGTRRMGGS